MNPIAQIFIVLMLFALVLTFIAKVRKREKYYMILKLLKSAIFFIAGCVCIKGLEDGREFFVICWALGLTMGLTGDFFLEQRRAALANDSLKKDALYHKKVANRYLKSGMAVFLLGHILYIMAFQSLLKFNIKTWVFALIVMTVTFLFLYVLETKCKFLKLSFGENGDAIYFYNIVLSILVGLAVGEFVLSGGTPISQHLLGSVALFYISDFILVLDYFSAKENRKFRGLSEALNLITYYAAQLGIAFIPLFLK